MYIAILSKILSPSLNRNATNSLETFHNEQNLKKLTIYIYFIYSITETTGYIHIAVVIRSITVFSKGEAAMRTLKDLSTQLVKMSGDTLNSYGFLKEKDSEHPGIMLFETPEPPFIDLIVRHLGWIAENAEVTVTAKRADAFWSSERISMVHSDCMQHVYRIEGGIYGAPVIELSQTIERDRGTLKTNEKVFFFMSEVTRVHLVEHTKSKDIDISRVLPVVS